MLSTALGILDATQNSIFDKDVMGLAGELHTRRNELSDKDFAKFLFMYSACLASKTADKTAQVCLTKEQYKEMEKATTEMSDLSDTILDELGE